MENVVGVLSHTLFLLAFLWTLSVLLFLDRTHAAAVVSTAFSGTAVVYYFRLLAECPVKAMARGKRESIASSVASDKRVECPLVVKEMHLGTDSDEEIDDDASDSSSDDDDKATPWLNEMRMRYQTRTKTETVNVSDVTVPKIAYEAVQWLSDVDLDDMKRGKKNMVDVKGLIGLPKFLRRPKKKIFVRMDGDKPVCEVTTAGEEYKKKDKAASEIDGGGERKRSRETFGNFDKRITGRCDCKYCRKLQTAAVRDVFAETAKRIPGSIRQRLSLADAVAVDESFPGLVLRDDGLIEESDDGRNVRLKLKKKRSPAAMHSISATPQVVN